MTRRERLENKIARREEWAAKARSSVEAVAKESAHYRGDYAFNTQPGHIPERARLIRREERAFGDLKRAEHHESRAAGLAAQLDAAVYRDDPDAIEALEARIAEREAEAEEHKRVNTAWRKTKGTPAERAAQLVAAGACGEALAKTIAETMRLCSWLKSPLDTTNLRASIRRDREHIEQLKRDAARRVEVEAAPGGVVYTHAEGGEFARLQFAEKPPRDVLDALRGAGWWWAGGGWQGRADALPESVRAFIDRAAPQPSTTE